MTSVYAEMKKLGVIHFISLQFRSENNAERNMCEGMSEHTLQSGPK